MADFKYELRTKDATLKMKFSDKAFRQILLDIPGTWGTVRYRGEEHTSRKYTVIEDSKLSMPGGHISAFFWKDDYFVEVKK